MPDFFLKAGDTAPALTRQLLDASGAIVNVTGATVRFHMRSRATGEEKVNAAATIVGAGTDGTVRYSWVVADTDTAGDYEGEFQVTFSDGSVQTFPNDKHMRIRIAEQLG